MTAIKIRRMSEADLEQVAGIERQVFADPWSFNAFKTDLNNDMAHPLVAELDNTVVGYVNLYIVADEIQIGNFAVAPGFRQRGVARKMMSALLQIAELRKCKSIFLEVRESNKAARKLYGSFGFAPAGRRENYYSTPRESAILMVKDI